MKSMKKQKNYLKNFSRICESTEGCQQKLEFNLFRNLPTEGYTNKSNNRSNMN